MCTAITFYVKDHYFGRNLDLEYQYNEAVTVTPRNFHLEFRCEKTIQSHYAIIGMAMVDQNYPLYYDATNEYGLSIAGLNFPGNAVYFLPTKGKCNITPFEFIPWILGQCRNTSEAIEILSKTNITNIPFHEKLPLTPLHWIISDQNNAITVESTEDGMHIYENPIGVLTNNPPFPFHMTNLTQYMNITRDEPINRFSNQIVISPFSNGMGSIGLPGDLSSTSRFIRAAFVKLNSICESNEAASVNQFLHILGSVSQQKGCVKLGNRYEKTVYSSCCNIDKGIYYYTTYENSRITAINMHRENLDEKNLSIYPLRPTCDIYWEN